MLPWQQASRFQVNTMIQQMKLENDALKAGLKEASVKTQQQTRQLEDRFVFLEKKCLIADDRLKRQRLNCHQRVMPA